MGDRGRLGLLGICHIFNYANLLRQEAANYVMVSPFIGVAHVTEIPFIDEDTKRELFSLLGDWYEPESTEFLFSSMPSDAVFFSS